MIGSKAKTGSTFDATIDSTQGALKVAVVPTSPTPSDEGPEGVDYLNYVRQMKEQTDIKGDFVPFLAVDPKMQKVRDIIHQIAPTNVSVLISGESGVGKEVVAKYIHSISKRRSEPFVAVNCAALPPTLLESELFGFEKGAFTGAMNRHIGKFEQASQGTLLLDEITEIDPGLQAKLLRAIQEREIERIGGRETIKINTRIIATSNRDLSAAVANGSFRQDLYYRLHVIPIEIPPLRERPADIAFLAKEFLKKYAQEYKRAVISFSEEALNLLSLHSWPGNVRELQNIVHRTVIMCQSPLIRAEEIPIQTNQMSNNHWVNALPHGITLQQVETEMILSALRVFNGNRTHAARSLGISLRTLRNKINEYTLAGIAVTEYGGRLKMD